MDEVGQVGFGCRVKVAVCTEVANERNVLKEQHRGNGVGAAYVAVSVLLQLDAVIGQEAGELMVEIYKRRRRNASAPAAGQLAVRCPLPGHGKPRPRSIHHIHGLVDVACQYRHGEAIVWTPMKETGDSFAEGLIASACLPLLLDGKGEERVRAIGRDSHSREQ